MYLCFSISGLCGEGDQFMGLITLYFIDWFGGSMAASANPSGNNSNNNNDQEGSSANANGATNNGSSVPHDNSPVGPTQAALRHNPGLSVEWTPDEQYLLEDLLNKYSSERNIVRYAKIAMQLKDKTVRDVALRCRWMNVILQSLLV
ncbi:uncharacterized protein LOC114258487 [Camellia sinensis]|uniref:uncharacterized protein LOC114258487 n=1 Tax=Camellia sinensis TaxID=4442 RepID=UPI00103679F7|nr:uncharacterized protein LOC114258487 [Camellia sinensis]